MTRVLVALHSGADDGAGRSIARVHDALVGRGYELEYWVAPGSPLGTALTARGRVVAGLERPIRYSPAALREPPGIARRLLATPGYLRAFAGRVREGGYDVVHANTLLCAPEVMLARRAGVPALLHVHEMLGTGPRDRAVVRAVRRADVVVTVSASAAAALAGHGVRAAIVPNGVELPAAPAPAAGDPPVVGTLGTICARKGSDLFVEAAGRLRHPATLRMTGPPADGPEREWVRALVDRARDRGIACPGREDGPTALAGLDVLVVPSRRDPFPLVVLEAMAAGLPVVGADVDGISEQLADGAGVLVAPGDPAALATAIDSLTADPERRRAIGAAARARVRRDFGLDRQAEGLATAYAEALSRARCRSGRSRRA